MTMRIGIDGVVFFGKRSGIGRYVYELCLELDKAMPEAQFFVYSREHIDIPRPSERWHLRIEPAPWFQRWKYMAWSKLLLWRLCRQDRIDAFWGCGIFLPWFLGAKVRTVVTIYDFNFIYAPETMARGTYWQHRLFLVRDARRADAVVCISKGTAGRLLENFGIKTASVVLPAVSPIFRRLDYDVVRQGLSSHDIDFSYILAVGNREPRKNLSLLVRVFLDLKNQGLLPEYLRLILAGGHGWKSEELDSLLAEPRNAERIIQLGYIPDEFLVLLYNGAQIFVFPSRYEGFGIPVVEAIACGANVIAGDVPEIREAGGDDATYIRAEHESLSKAIQNGINNQSMLRDEEPCRIEKQTANWIDAAVAMKKIFMQDEKVNWQ